ncbi:MAG: methylmalonyl Co-A mutase-associated GTPase MeaB [Planctomycetes bacterium]|nr:methylmalonyl Co-A mutase-associated GTPase MeaB [Planctomycetota bacterium]
MATTPSIADRLLAGDRTALARLISWAENGDPRFRAEHAVFYPRVGRARRIGVTGPPGAGKSTLVNELARVLREQKKTVGILAVDPTSPISGGALLGDRIRMEGRTLDPGVFIRSMASRDSHGGLARAAVDACDAMDAFGFDVILLETVGVGQAEYDVVGAADSVLVVLCPGAGDGIQAMKAGLLEVADFLVVNKCDLPGADRLQNDLSEAVHVRFTKRAWTPPIVAVSASTEFGIVELLQEIEKHFTHLASSNLVDARREKRVQHVENVVNERLRLAIWRDHGWRAHVERELARSISPYEVAAGVLAELSAGLIGARTERGVAKS